MKKLVFYKCEVCGNVAVKLVDKGVPMFCCGQKMSEIKPNTVDGAVEKHKPVFSIKGNVVEVKVGQVPHPMGEEHYISHIILQTTNGFSVKTLQPNDQPQATFALSGSEKVEAVYSYCNLHGLWS